jgi:glycosyltransferase involved in cell wall biosynthesis
MILHLCTFQLEGGAGVAASRLNQALQNHGIDSHLLVYRQQKAKNGVTAWADTPWKNSVFWARFSAERLLFLPHEKDKTVRFAFSPAAVGVPIEEHPLVQQADVINIHWINFGFLSLAGLSRLFSLGKPIVWTMHDMWAFTGGCHYSSGCELFLTHCQFCPFLKKPALYDLSFEIFEKKKKLLAEANVSFVSPSKWLGHLTQKASITAHLPSYVIPNPIDTAVFHPLSKADARLKLGLPLDKKLILFAGANTLDPRKGYEYFREAIHKLDTNNPGVEIAFFGKSQPGAYQEINLPVHDLGKLSDQDMIVAAYSAADAMVVTSLEDNLPNTVMEAMACGTPVVGFQNGGIPDMIDHLENGYIASFKSALSVAEGIQWVLDNNQGGKLSALARQKVLTTYSEEVVARQYADLYQSLR